MHLVGCTLEISVNHFLVSHNPSTVNINALQALNEIHDTNVKMIQASITITNRSKPREHVSHVLRDETAELQEVLFTEARGFIFSFSALQLTVKCAAKILVHQ